MKTRLFKIRLDLSKDEIIAHGAVWISAPFDKYRWRDQIIQTLKAEKYNLVASTLKFSEEGQNVYATGEAVEISTGKGIRTYLPKRESKHDYPPNDMLT